MTYWTHISIMGRYIHLETIPIVFIFPIFPLCHFMLKDISLSLVLAEWEYFHGKCSLEDSEGNAVGAKVQSGISTRTGNDIPLKVHWK